MSSATEPPSGLDQLRAVFVNCTLKKSPRQSHTSGLMAVSRAIMEKQGVEVDEIRAVDHDIAPGVYADMTEHEIERDDWPTLWKRIEVARLAAVSSPAMKTASSTAR